MPAHLAGGRRNLLLAQLIIWLAGLSACIGQDAPTTNVASRLAIVVSDPLASAAGDLLTVSFSRQSGLQLLERDQIQRVYREQSLSAANRDQVQLGRLLGADGLLVLQLLRAPRETNLTARLIAVKPGVIVLDESFSWPLDNPEDWADSFVKHAGPFMSKLRVSAKAAIPVSIVNFRAAIDSAEEQNFEKQLKLLTIQRLSRQPTVFVLERQRMRSLTEEKALNADESAFWDGKYLVEAVVDERGYDPAKATVSVRLTPPQAGTKVTFEVSGSRTNVADIALRLTAQIASRLQVQTALPAWEPADEAAQFYNDALWALRWGLYPEAQMAAESAWALGKHDLNCALARIRAYVNEVPDVLEPKHEHYVRGKRANYVHTNEVPDPRFCDVALLALQCYEEFSRSSPDGEPRILTRGRGWNDWHNSEWYQAGLDALTAASRVLQHFYFHREAQSPVADKLPELRRAARSVAKLIADAPTVRDSYFVGERVVTHDELSHTLEENPNIFRCETGWGCFWQERPEEAIVLYRELMSSAAFCYFHQDLWNRSPIRPRLVAWSEPDQQRTTDVWEAFIRELKGSTNVLLRMEALGFAKSEAKTPQQVAAADQQWFELVRSNRSELVGNNVELFYLGWHFASNPETEALDREYWQQVRTVPRRKPPEVLAAQKQFLTGFAPYEFKAFDQLFLTTDYSKQEAAELLPLVAAYKSNLLAQSAITNNHKAKADAHAVEFFLERRLSRALNPPAATPVTAAKPAVAPANAAPAPSPAPTILRKPPPNPDDAAEQTATNIVFVHRFFKIPFDRLPQEGRHERSPAPRLWAQVWSEGKLLTEVAYQRGIDEFDEKGNWKHTRLANLSALMIFAPDTGTWELIERPESAAVDSVVTAMTANGYHSVFLNGELFSCDAGRFQKYDRKTRQWRSLPVPETYAAHLFAVEGRLYAASADIIIEIVNGSEARVLASTRRRPTASALDTLDDFGAPLLFSALDHSLCASVGNTVHRWTGSDWEQIPTVSYSRAPDVFADAAIFRSVASPYSGKASGLWLWTKDRAVPELCFTEKPPAHPASFTLPPRRETPAVEAEAKPVWQALPGEFLADAPATMFGTNVYFFLDHAAVTNDGRRWTAVARNGYHAKLVCLSRDCREPIVVPLKFDPDQGPPPLKALGRQMEPWLAFNSTALDTVLYCHGNTLFIAQRHTPGVWAVPFAEILPALALQKQVVLGRRALADAGSAQARQQLLARHDRNHNGLIDPDEREDALDDPAFISSELEIIDANHNGLLDLQELAYFDANRNQILEPKEQAAIEIAQQLLADKLIEQFDANHDGVLDRSEFRALQSSYTRAGVPMLTGYPDKNHDGVVDSKELGSFFIQNMRESLHWRPGFRAFARREDQNADPRALFKADLEAFWQNPTGAPRMSPPGGPLWQLQFPGTNRAGSP